MDFSEKSSLKNFIRYFLVFLVFIVLLAFLSGDSKMKTSKLIKAKQSSFALNQNVKLRSRKKNKGALFYTEERDKNLLSPLLDKVIEQFDKGDGNEIRPSYSGDLPKIQAVHSSSAIVVNLFSYWLELNNLIPLAIALKLVSPKTRCSLSMEFEAKLPISDNFKRAPNLDVLFKVEGKSRFLAFGIESKLSEPFSGRGHKGLNPVYLANEFWTGLPNLKALAGRLSPQNHEFKHLDVIQLLKHILGLKRAFKMRFKLLYLYWEGSGLEGGLHALEIDKFSQITRLDKVEFRSISYQDLIDRLATKHREEHEKYIKFITSRYL